MSQRCNHPELNRIVDGIQERRCTHCKHWQPLTDFILHVTYRGYCCKACNRMAQRARRAKLGMVSDGTGDILRTLKALLNRVVDGKPERCCRKCDKWQPIEAFPLRQGSRKYRCYTCEKKYDRAYKRHRRENGIQEKRARPIRPVIKAFLSFASMPTPDQLERKAA